MEQVFYLRVAFVTEGAPQHALNRRGVSVIESIGRPSFSADEPTNDRRVARVEGDDLLLVRLGS